eukprot:2306240-Rhodomonas_salina.1
MIRDGRRQGGGEEGGQRPAEDEAARAGEANKGGCVGPSHSVGGVPSVTVGPHMLRTCLLVTVAALVLRLLAPEVSRLENHRFLTVLSLRLRLSASLASSCQCQVSGHHDPGAGDDN